jgi:hypothetical protein
MNIAAGVGTVGESVKSGFQGAEAIVDIVRKWRSWRISDVTTLKMLYLELDRFLELVELFDLKIFARRTPDPATVFALLTGVDLTVTGLVLAREEKHSAFRKIMRRGFIGRKKRIERFRDYTNVLQALSFIYSKTAILKQISETGDKALFREIKFAERLQNIAGCVNQVLKVLVTFREVNVIARRWHRPE